MIRYKCSEIISSALKLSQLNNSNMFTSRDYVEVLNTQYRDIFNLLVDAGDGFYMKTFIADKYQQPETGMTVVDLPRDFYQLAFVGVFNAVDPSLSMRIERIPSSSPARGYMLENKKLLITAEIEGPYIIKYIPVPKTLTVPAPTLTLPITEDDIYCAKFHGFWRDTGFYSIDAETTTPWTTIGIPFSNFKACNDLILNETGLYRVLQMGTKPMSIKINNTNVNSVTNIASSNGDLFIDGHINQYEFPDADKVWKYAYGFLEFRENSVYFDGQDYTDLFCGIDMNGTPLTLADYDNVVVYDNFVYMLYDHRLIVFNGLEKYRVDDDADDAIPGIVDRLNSCSIDDRTLYGVHINNCQLASFVPDTILDYPNNAFYDLLISRVAGQLLLIAKQDPANAVMLAGQLQTQLLKTIRRDAFQMKTINNVYRRRGL